MERLAAASDIGPQFTKEYQIKDKQDVSIYREDMQHRMMGSKKAGDCA